MNKNATNEQLTHRLAEAEDALANARAHEDIYRTLFESIDDAFCIVECIVDETGQVVDCIWREVNPAWLRHTGLPDPIGKRASTLMPSLHQSWSAILTRVIATGNPEQSEGDYSVDLHRWFRSHYARVGDHGSRLAAIRVEDITEQLAAERARFHLAAIVNSADDAIVGKDLNSIVTSWNPAAARLFGYSADEMIGQSIRRIIPDELQSEEDMILHKVQSGERIEHFETTRLRKNGQRINVSVTVSPVRDDAGRIIGASKIARDISEKMKLQQLLIQAEKIAATGRMAATVAHELNNPLEAVLNLMYLARHCCSVNDEASSYLATAEIELQRVAHISRQTLGYYRSTARPAEFSISGALDELLKVYTSKLQNAAVVVERRYTPSRNVVANRGEMLQVFSNLIVNAIDAMRHGGTLTVAVAPVEREGKPGHLVTIADTGTGIPPEDLSQIFEPFFTTKGDLGNGIGLWISKEAVEKHGGTITIESVSTGDNTGTIASVFLPQATLPEED